MLRRIERMSGHVIVCGYGRAGRATADYLVSEGRSLVVVDRDPERLRNAPYPTVLGDVTDEEVLRTAGIERAAALIAAVNSDADNVYLTLSSRALRPDLVIVARARGAGAKANLLRAGANRAVNPQLIGGRRMGSFALAPHVAEFLDVVMHDENLDLRIEQFEIATDCSVADMRLADSPIRSTAGATLLALRTPSGRFVNQPRDDTRLVPKTVLIVLGNAEALARIAATVRVADAHQGSLGTE